MPSQTPQFDKALDEYFNSLRADKNGGLWKICRFSSRRFYVRPEDIKFYKSMKVPLPTLEPEERRRRRLASHNSYTLFKAISAYSKKKIISLYPSTTPFNIYEHQVWYSDKWDPMSYGRPYDSTRPFIGQFHELRLQVPRPNLFSSPLNVNSEYTNNSKDLKNCYFTFDQNKGEDLYYHDCCSEDKNCIDCFSLDQSDTCYGSRMSDHLFRCFFCEYSKQCMNSYFLYDCHNSSYCFMSSNLRNKQYYVRNQYIGKEAYEKFMRGVYTGSWKELEKFKKEFNALKIAAPRKPSNNLKAVASFGDYIINSKNAYFGFYILESENVAYSEGLSDSRECYDVLGGVGSERCYELVNNWEEDNYESLCSAHIDNSEEVEYSELLRNCRACFGCVGLENKSYCILNIQYTPKEYWRIVDEIRTKMLFEAEYGEYFAPQYHAFPYRASYIPYYEGYGDYEEAKKYGYDTRPLETVSEEIIGDVIDTKDLPDDIKDVKDDILKKIIYDSKNKKHFRIVKQELQFYRKHEVPLPREHPGIRMMKWRDDLNLIIRYYKRKCAHCGEEIETTYSPDRPEKNIWCEKCYLSEIK